MNVEVTQANVTYQTTCAYIYRRVIPWNYCIMLIWGKYSDIQLASVHSNRHKLIHYGYFYDLYTCGLILM